jgi:hypothetical protein
MSKDDTIDYNGHRYSIIALNEYEFGSAWVVTADMHPDVTPPTFLTQSVSAGSDLTLLQAGGLN